MVKLYPETYESVDVQLAKSSGISNIVMELEPAGKALSEKIFI